MLQKVLQNEGHEVWIIDRDFKRIPFYRKVLSKIKYNVLKIGSKFISSIATPVYPFWISKQQLKYISIHTNAFVQENIKRTEKITTDFELKRISKKYGFDCYIVGSDQVWRPSYSPCIENYYLDFIKDVEVKRIAYAASFGVDSWEYSVKETTKCAKLAKLFDAISVREDSGVNLCLSNLNVNAEHVLDPTMLYEKEDYKKTNHR